AADRLLDRLAALGQGDLVEQYFVPLTASTVNGLVGLGDVSVEELRGGLAPTVTYMNAKRQPPEAKAQNTRFDDRLRSRMRVLRSSRDGEDGSVLATLLETATPLTEREILANVKLMTAAGLNELKDTMTHTLLGLLSRPDQLEELRADPTLARAA